MRADVIAPSLVDLGSQGAGTVTPDLSKGGTYFRVTCTASTLTIANPISGVHTPWSGSGADVANPVALEIGTIVFFEVKNTSGGALTVTWGNLVKGAPGNPATGQRKVHAFCWDGSNLLLMSAAPDIPN
jgi:hypothetical protein